MTPNRDVAIHLDRIDAVIFDMDGVVTDTAGTHAAAWKHLFDEYLRERASRSGEPFQPFDAGADYLWYVDGKPRYDGVESFLRSRGISIPYGAPDDPPGRGTVCGLGNRKNRYFLASLQEQGVKPYQSSIEFIRVLRTKGVRTAIISASRNCAEVLDAAGVRDLFDVKVDGVDADELGLKGKPDPAIFLEAAKRLGVDPARAAVIEDALAGVEAGHRGGFALVVGVDRAGQAEALKERGADVVVQDLAELGMGGAKGSPQPQATTRAMRDLPSAIENEQEIGHHLEGRTLAVFLDYDGTLTPIVAHPSDAVLPEDTREVVKRLATYCTVAVISGRDLADVRDMVSIEGIAYAGSHGFDIVGADGTHRDEKRWQRFLPALDHAEKELQRSLEDIPGARVERKRFAIAVHYRGMDDSYLETLEQRVDQVAAQEPELRKSGGKKVFELRPNVDWDKGKALLSLLDALGLGDGEVVPLFIGDDVTDEDAFRAIRDRGIGIIVGDDERQTAAHYALYDPGEVRTFLEALLTLLKGNSE